MWNNMIFKDGFVGFGLTEEEAEEDWYLNRCRENLQNDEKELFVKRRQELKPWLPKKELVHISGIACIQYRSGEVRNTRTGERVVLSGAGYEAYYYLSQVLGDTVTYSDITIVMQEELTQFFQNISSDFIPLKEYPCIKVAERSSQFNPKVVYTLKSGVLIGCDNQYLGAKMLGDEQYHLVELESKKDMRGLLSYLGYRIGVSFSKGGVGFGKSN